MSQYVDLDEAVALAVASSCRSLNDRSAIKSKSWTFSTVNLVVFLRTRTDGYSLTYINGQLVMIAAACAQSRVRNVCTDR